MNSDPSFNPGRLFTHNSGGAAYLLNGFAFHSQGRDKRTDLGRRRFTAHDFVHYRNHLLFIKAFLFNYLAYSFPDHYHPLSQYSASVTMQEQAPFPFKWFTKPFLHRYSSFHTPSFYATYTGLERLSLNAEQGLMPNMQENCKPIGAISHSLLKENFSAVARRQGSLWIRGETGHLRWQVPYAVTP